MFLIRQQLRTVHLVPLTAFDASGQINVRLQAEHTERMAAAGIRVFLPAAGTSEFHSLSPDEIVELVRITRQAASPDALVFAPVGFQLPLAIATARRSLEVGADGIMFMPFVHPYLSDSGVRDYYHAVLNAAACPAVIYKTAPIPSDPLLLELAADERVVGVKYAVNNLHDFRRAVLTSGGQAEWLCGSAERFAPYFMLAGAGGYTSGAGNICPRLTLAMHAALAAGRYAEAMRLQQTMLPIEDFRGREGESFSISMLKAAMSELGADFGPARPPQRRPTPAEQAEISKIVAAVVAAEAELSRT